MSVPVGTSCLTCHEIHSTGVACPVRNRPFQYLPAAVLIYCDREDCPKWATHFSPNLNLCSECIAADYVPVSPPHKSDRLFSRLQELEDKCTNIQNQVNSLSAKRRELEREIEKLVIEYNLALEDETIANQYSSLSI